MAGQDGTAPHNVALFDALHEAPHAFAFYQAVRRLECAYRDKPRIGKGTRPVSDPVRFAQEPSLNFASATLAAFEPAKDGRPPRLVQRFHGLFGPNGPLPLHLTEYARERMRNHRDHTLVRFLDVFHHRMTALFYRAWSSAQPTVSLDRPEDDRFALYVGSLFGMGMPTLRDRDAMPDLAKLSYAGHFSCQTRHADGLEAILSDFFEIPAKIYQFIGQWLELAKPERWRLGKTMSMGTLGLGAILGPRVWSCQHKFRIVMGPMSLVDYSRLLPGGDILKRLVAVVRNYIGDELDWDVNLVLQKEEVPAFRLGQAGQLGWTTWLYERKTDADANDLALATHIV